MRFLTKRGYEFGEVSSAMQKAIRRGDTRLAGYWALELWASGYGNYVWKRLLTVSAEDCWGILTQEVKALHDSYALVNQNVPACVAAGTNNGCRPISTYANNSQYSPLADSTYHGLHVSFVQRPTSWGNYRVSYAWSKSMNNVGEAFFSSPIDPFDLSKDWGRSDDDQRHRLVLSGSINSPTGPAHTAWERISHGFQASSLLQAYSPLPFNITSGVTTVQRTAGRPIVNGAFIERNAGVGAISSA
jgi:hypothetical protein